MRKTLPILLFAVLGLIASSGYGATPKAKTKSKSKPCFATLDQCPPIGCAAKGSPDALLNGLKSNVPASGGPVVQLTLDDFAELQNQADSLVGQKGSLTAAQRKKLKDLKTKDGRKVGEGDVVEVMGFLVADPHANTSESVNCKLRGADNNDFHLTIARSASDSDFDGIVVEMIPQARKDGWDLGNLREVESEEWPVLVRGQLIYDNKHNVNDNPENPSSGDPRRFALFEVHPITAFLVCQADPCDPADASRWTPLEKVNFGNQ